MKGHRDEIWERLQRGEHLTAASAYSLFGCLSLSQRISELRKEGKRIRSKLAKGRGRNGNPCQWAEYWLEI